MFMLSQTVNQMYKQVNNVSGLVVTPLYLYCTQRHIQRLTLYTEAHTLTHTHTDTLEHTLIRTQTHSHTHTQTHPDTEPVS